jgi:hypothetical protein
LMVAKILDSRMADKKSVKRKIRFIWAMMIPEKSVLQLQGLPQKIQGHSIKGKWAGSRIVDGYCMLCRLLWNCSITTKFVFFTE